VPKPTAASAASPIDARPAARHSGSGSRAASTTPGTARRTPRVDTSPGSSPWASPPAIGTSTPRAPIVATMLIEPSAIAR
jgi:hypothetical protein